MSKGNLIGKKIIEIRLMNEIEQESEGWDEAATVIVLDGGQKIYASCDDEGNAPGVIFGTTKKGQKFTLMGG